MNKKQNFFQKLSRSSVVLLPYLLGLLVAIFLNSVPIFPVPSGGEPFLLALFIAIGVSSFIGFPVIALVWITQAIVKRFWKAPTGDKTFKFLRKVNHLLSSFILSTFLSCLLFVCFKIILIIPYDFWQKINPINTPQSQWNMFHYFMAFSFGLLFILFIILFIIYIFAIIYKFLEKLRKLIENQRRRMGSNQQILNVSLSVVNIIYTVFSLTFLLAFFLIVIGGIGWLIFIILPKSFLFKLPLIIWLFILVLSSPAFLLIPRLTRKKSLKNQAESPQNIQEKAIVGIQNHLDNIRQKINIYTANKNNLEQQYKEAQEAAETSQQRVAQALQQGEEVLASEALSHHQRYTDTAIELKTKLEELTIQIDSLQWDLRTHERKLVLAELELAQIKAAEAESKQAQLMTSTKHNTNITLTVRSILNLLAGRAKDTALLQEQSVIDMDEELAALRRELTKVTETQKYFQQEYEKAQRKADEWQQKAQSFLQAGNEQQASEALSQQQYYSDIALDWKVQLDEQTVNVDSLKHNLSDKQYILAVAKAERDILKLRKRYHER